MALTKNEKQELIVQVSGLLADSKMTVVAEYQGTTVKAMQLLRRQARDNGTKVKVVKNRLFKQALLNTEGLKDVDAAALEGMLVYAFNAQDEVAPAQALANFAKTNPTIKFVGAITADGKFMAANDVTTLAKLPGKNLLIAGIINTLNAPVRGVMGSLGGNLHALLDGVAAKATN